MRDRVLLPPVQAVPAKEMLGAGLGAVLAAQLALAPVAIAGPELPGNLNNPFGDDLQRTRDASKMPATRGTTPSLFLLPLVACMTLCQLKRASHMACIGPTARLGSPASCYSM